VAASASDKDECASDSGTGELSSSDDNPGGVVARAAGGTASCAGNDATPPLPLAPVGARWYGARVKACTNIGEGPWSESLIFFKQGPSD